MQTRSSGSSSAVEPLVVVGAGAAGLMAAIFSGRAGRPALVLDSARILGAKILVSGGGRCNVTHDVVSERDFCGSTPAAIRNVLRRFGVAETQRFFSGLGVQLKREESGKLFPTTDESRSVLDALLEAARAAGASIRHPCSVETVDRVANGFRVTGAWGSLLARRVLLATGGKSLPKSGSDGHGLDLARSLGHSVTPRLVPALVGLTLADGCFLRDLSGLSLPAALWVRASNGKRLAARSGSTLCTHFGLSGPAPMDVSRHIQLAQADDPGATLCASWLPDLSAEALDAEFQRLGSSAPLSFLSARLPARFARALCVAAEIEPAAPGSQLTREQRRALVRAALEMELPYTGTRGWNAAEATAGGVPLSEVRLQTMESRVAPGLFLCGEMLDVDGYIGGYNFQWAWASGSVAGRGAASV